MITFDMASPLDWVAAVTVTVAAWIWLALLIEELRGLQYRYRPTHRQARQAFLQLAHRLERLGIDLAEKTGLTWPWPPSQLERQRVIMAAVDVGDLLMMKGFGDSIRLASVAIRQLGVTTKQATAGLQAFAKAWNAWQDEITPGRQSATGKRN